MSKIEDLQQQVIQPTNNVTRRICTLMGLTYES